MFVLGFVFGCLVTLAILYLRFFGFGTEIHEGGAAIAPLPLAMRRKEKRKPKFVSEEEQFKREQRQAPADPV